jgi:serine/threonine protein kinase
LPALQAAGYVQKIACAIEFAHQRGVLHRDLKPSNVLINAFDDPQVTDFGLARQLAGESDLTVTGQVLGSPNFMPPEQASADSARLGRASHVYGLGAILYHLLTGRPPFLAETFEATLRQLLERPPISPRQLNPTIPADLETICLKCLEKEPARRYQTAQELAAELGRFLSGEPIHARPVSRTERVLRWCRRKPALASASQFEIICTVWPSARTARVSSRTVWTAW